MKLKVFAVGIWLVAAEEIVYASAVSHNTTVTVLAMIVVACLVIVALIASEPSRG